MRCSRWGTDRSRSLVSLVPSRDGRRENDEAGNTFVAYDNVVSLLAQYQREEITQVAQVVEQKLEALLAAVTQ